MKRRDFLIQSGAGFVAGSLSNSITASASNAVARPERVIDVHTHLLITFQIPEFAQAMAKKYTQVTHEVGIAQQFGLDLVVFRDFAAFGKQQQVSEDAGVTLRLLSATMQLATVHAATLMPTLEAAQRMNDIYIRVMQQAPGKVVGMIAASPFERDHLAEIERCMKLGMKGIGIDTSMLDDSGHRLFLDDEATYPFWEFVDHHGIAVFLHPAAAPIGSEYYNRYKLEEVVGRPCDTAVCVARMIYAGILDRYPRLKLVAAHMGGALNSMIGRLDMGYRLGYEGLPEDQKARCAMKPSEYLRRNIWVDTMGFWRPYLNSVIETFGVDRVLFGTDYGPVPISPSEHIELVQSLDISSDAKDAIFWRNANELFGLSS